MGVVTVASVAGAASSCLFSCLASYCRPVSGTRRPAESVVQADTHVLICCQHQCGCMSYYDTPLLQAMDRPAYCSQELCLCCTAVVTVLQADGPRMDLLGCVCLCCVSCKSCIKQQQDRDSSLAGLPTADHTMHTLYSKHGRVGMCSKHGECNNASACLKLL